MTLFLSRPKLQTFWKCQRQFQLRYVSELAWPRAPLPPQLATAFERGQQFHQLLERSFLGLEPNPAQLDPHLNAWWQAFQQSPPDALALPDSEQLPELTLTVPVIVKAEAEPVYLFGRFDLLVLTPNEAHIIDWKTERQPRTKAALRDDWQTQLYLALVAEADNALSHTYKPEQIAITYWFAQAPEQSVTIRYDQDWHTRTWATLTAESERITRKLATPDAIWPLTDDLDQCGKCAYQTFCDRVPAEPVTLAESDIDFDDDFDSDFAQAAKLEAAFLDNIDLPL